VILAVDDESEDLGRLEHELRKRYEADYRVVCEASAEAGLQKLRELKVAEANLAIVIAAQRMPRIKGVEFLARVREAYPSPNDCSSSTRWIGKPPICSHGR
jgi:thioredoxin reductase (NADPH)